MKTGLIYALKSIFYPHQTMRLAFYLKPAGGAMKASLTWCVGHLNCQLMMIWVWEMVTLLQDVTIVHWNCCGVCSSAVQDQARRASVGKAETPESKGKGTMQDLSYVVCSQQKKNPSHNIKLYLTTNKERPLPPLLWRNKRYADSTADLQRKKAGML